MRKTVLGLLASLCLLAAGCLPAVVGGGAAGIREITDKALTYDCDVAAAEAGVRAAVKDMGGEIRESVMKEKENGARTLRGRTYDGERLTIDLEPTGPQTTQIDIRVGRIGSKSRAEDFHIAIQKHLKLRAAAAPAP